MTHTGLGSHSERAVTGLSNDGGNDADTYKPLAIRPGVYFAAVQGEGIVMDLLQDRYLGLSAASALIWQGVASGKPLQDIKAVLTRALPDDPQSAIDTLLADQLDAWRKERLLSENSHSDSELPIAKPCGGPGREGLDKERLERSRISPIAFLRLVRWRWWSKRVRTAHGVCAVLSRVQRIPVASAEGQPRREADVYRVVRTYYLARRALSQGKNDCLWRSLALAAVLRSIGLNAEVCFGVQKFPFQAHAWVEADGRVINERPTSISMYIVIARF